VNKKSPLSAFLTAILVAGLVLAGAMGFGTAQASTDVNGVPEFTLRYVDNSYDVPPTTTSTTDPYTNEITTTTVPGYHVENKTVEAVIKNDLGASYYNFRYKGHFSEEWSYYPSDPDSVSGYNHYDYYSVPYQASASSYTEATLSSFLFESSALLQEVKLMFKCKRYLGIIEQNLMDMLFLYLRPHTIFILKGGERE
jgi:hypothetical protein